MKKVLVYGMVGTNRGGIENYLLKMSSFMSKEIIFDYVIEEETCIHEKEICDKGGKIYQITKRTKAPIKNILDNKKILKKLKKEIEAVYFNVSSLSWIFPIGIALNEGYRVFVHAHNSQYIEANSSCIHKITNYFNKIILSYWKINRLTCSECATKFIFMPYNSVDMIYNAIDIDKFTFNENSRKKIRVTLECENKKVIGFVGRLNDQKNPLFLLEIIKEISRHDDNYVMMIIGEGPMRNKLEGVIENYNLKEKVLVLGNVDNVNDYMQAMDIFVLPSLHEGLPYVVIEAQTAGLNCIISDRITKEVDATGKIDFLALEEGPDYWRKKIMENMEKQVEDRCVWGMYMEKTEFNILNEAKKLEKILTE